MNSSPQKSSCGDKLRPSPQREENYPLGGQVAQDYVFDEGPADLSEQGEVRQTRLSELFDPGKDSLLVYSYMYGPAMATPCTSCTSILDGLNGTAPHVRNRVNFAVEFELTALRSRLDRAASGFMHGL